jgi:LCP family protein required for cell wall assembly
VTLLVLTLLLPGSAQLAAGNRRVGRAALRVWAGMLAAALLVGLLALVSRETALSLLTHRWTLAVLEVVLLAAAVGWALLLVDAWRLGRPDRLPQRDRRGLLALLLGLLLVPALVGWVGLSAGTARAAMTSVFQDGRAVGAVDGRYNILLLGGDSGAGRWGLRPDSIQLASVDAETGKAVLLGFSRETENIHFNPGSVMARLMPQGWVCGDQCLLNALYTWAVDHKGQFPKGTKDPGILATREAVEWLTGLDVQYYVMVDLKGFSTLVDAVGGLDITVQRRTPMGGGSRPIFDHIEPGRQHLDGYHALWYARSRVDSTNYERMARQRCVVTALVKQLDPRTVLLNFGDIAKATKGVFRTDIPQDALASLADVGVRTKQQRITSVNFVPPLIKPWDYDPQVVRSTVATAIAASEKGRSASAKATTTAAPAGAAAATPVSAAPQPSTPAVMERPGTDPDADTKDLASVCSAG